MPKKLPSNGYIQFGKQLDLFEEAVKEHTQAVASNDGMAEVIASAAKEKERGKLLDLFEKKGK